VIRFTESKEKENEKADLIEMAENIHLDTIAVFGRISKCRTLKKHTLAEVENPARRWVY
jgi:hypothetical protein